eukprot:1042931-Pyramimonas_sp.AAC.2
MVNKDFVPYNFTARIDWRIKSLPVIPVRSATGVGGLIDLRALQERCGLGDINHKCVHPQWGENEFILRDMK